MTCIATSVAFSFLETDWNSLKNSGSVGHWCSTMNNCSANFCENGGICISNNSDDATCLCPPGYSGSRCEHPFNPCELVSVTGACNHGSCEAHFDQLLPYYYCDCEPGIGNLKFFA